MAMKKLITNGMVLTMNEAGDTYPDGYIMFEDGVITETGSMCEMPPERQQAFAADGWQIENAARAIVMPGMVNTHSHLGMVPFRGLGDDCRDRLRVFLLPMEQKAMNEELVAASTRYAVCELFLSGVTCVLDMYYFEMAVAKVMDEMGIRGIAGETVMEEGACDFRDPEEALEYGKKLIAKYQDHPRISGALTPHGTNTCRPEHLKAAYEMDAAAGVPFSLHAAEMDYEMSYMQEMYGITPFGFLEKTGVLGPVSALAHCIHMTDEDIALMKKYGSGVCHCIASNTKAAKGVAPVLKLLEAGVPVGLGSDGPASGNTLDLFAQMRLCANFQKTANHDRSAMPAKDIVAMATIGGARVLGLDHITGSLEAGKAADITLVETDSVNMFPVYDPYSALVYSANSSNVCDVYVAGEQRVKDKKLVKADLEEIKKELKRVMDASEFGKMGELH